MNGTFWAVLFSCTAAVISSYAVVGFFGSTFLALLLAPIPIFVWSENVLREGGESRQSFYRRIRDGSRGRHDYRRRLGAILDWLDARLSYGLERATADTAEQPSNEGGANEPSARVSHSLNGPAFVWCLRIALVYPIAALFAIWLYTGIDVSSGDLLGFDMMLSERLLFTLLMGVVLWSYLKVIQTSGWIRLAWFAIPSGIVVAGIAASIVAATFYITIAVTISMIIAVVISVAGTIVGAVAISVAGSIAGAISFSLSFSGNTPFANISFISSTFPVKFIYAISISVFIAFSVATAEHCAKKRRQLGVFYAVFSFLVICLIVAGITNIIDERSGPALLPLLVFFVLLPLVNSTFDWLSLAITRLLLRRGIAGQTPFWLLWLGDVLFAGFMLVTLTMCTVLLLAFFSGLVEARTGTVLFDVQGLLAALRDPELRFDPSVWWVYIVLFSTFVPTFMHGVIMSGSFVGTTLPRSWWRWAAWAIRKPGINTDEPRRRKLTLFLTGLRMASWLLPIAVLLGVILLIAVFAPWLARAILTACEWAVSLVEPAVVPGPVGPFTPPIIEWLDV